MPLTACPSPDRLVEYSASRLAAGDAERIASHLADCPTCQDSLRAAETVGGDTAVDARLLPHSSTVPEHPFGKYELLELLGQGGMGRVFKARQTHLDKTVALKLLDPDRLESPEALSRFRREVEAASKLVHPNIVRAVDAGVVDRTPYLAMEWIDGETLSDRVKRGAVPAREACGLIIQAAAGLQCAHDHGLVHRDVKPSNLIVAGGVVKVLDLGLALSVKEQTEDATREYTILGTADYIAPEQANHSRGIDARADTYGLGCTLYHLLSGRPPYADRSSNVEKLLAHQFDAAPAMRGLPRGLMNIVSRMMGKAPGDRFASMNEVAAALKPFAQGTGRNRLRVPFSVFIAASAIGIAIAFWQPWSGHAQKSEEPPPPTPAVPVKKTRQKLGKPADPDRAAAEWVLKSGGSVGLIEGMDKKSTVGKNGPLPDGPFRVQSVVLYEVEGVDDDGIELLTYLEHVDELNLAGTEITDKGIDELSRIPSMNTVRFLVLPRHGQITDASLASIGANRGFQKVLDIDITGSTITGGGIKSIAALPDLVGLRIHWGGAITDEGFAEVAKLRLHYMLLGSITTPALKELSQSESLWNIDLRKAATLDDLRYLLGFKLRWLRLNAQSLNDESMSIVGGMSRLESLDIYDGSITGVGLSQLSKLKNLKTLRIDRLRTVKAESVSQLSRELPKCKITWDGVVLGSK